MQLHDHIPDAVAATGTAAGGFLAWISITHADEIVRLIAGCLSCLGICTAMTYHIMKIRRMRKDRTSED